MNVSVIRIYYWHVKQVIQIVISNNYLIIYEHVVFCVIIFNDIIIAHTFFVYVYDDLFMPVNLKHNFLNKLYSTIHISQNYYEKLYIDIIVWKRVVGFIERLKVSDISIISCIDNSWKMKFNIYGTHGLNCYIINYIIIFNVQLSIILYLLYTYHHFIYMFFLAIGYIDLK